ncbi:MAG: CHASE2 domain-containing protein [Lachnospiraceae bacterium]|nr:CHASE2 domain-containing protein [Lachnospiraceae bacterium]
MKNQLYKLVYVIVIALIFVMVVFDPLYSMDMLMTDHLYSRLDGPDSNIIIIGIDEETLSKYGNFTLWSREKLAELVNWLYEDEENAPCVIGMDFILTDHYKESSDIALSEAVKGKNVVIGTNIVYRGAVETGKNGEKYYNKGHIYDVEMPYEELNDVAEKGFTNEYIASDGYIRYSRNSIVLPEKLREKAGKTQDSFAYRIYRMYQEETGGSVKVPKLNKGGQFQFLYSGESGEFSEVSLDAVLSGKIPHSAFRNAIVLVGAYAPGLQDSYQAASDRGSVMYGVEIHANIIQAYMNEKTLVSADSYLVSAVISVIIILLLIVLRKKVLFITLPVSVLVAGIYTVCGRILSGKGIFLSLVYMYLALLLLDMYFILEKYLRELIANYRYQEEIKEQMWSFTEAMATAIDERTPYNVSHTRNVAKYSGMLADYINVLHDKGEEEEYFSVQRKEQLVMGALLHDIGKIAVPLSVMNKETRLNGLEKNVEERLRTFRLEAKISVLERKKDEAWFSDLTEKAEEAIRVMNKVNGTGFVDDELKAQLDKVLNYEYEDSSGNVYPFFTEEEKECLRIERGTLTDKEREIMHSHVEITERILNKVHFNKYFENSPVYAVQHHECLNGKGYPKGLKGDELSTDARIIAVADICDALLAADRPYKKPMPREKAFEIMRNMAKEGNIDSKLVEYLYECTKPEEKAETDS